MRLPTFYEQNLIPNCKRIRDACIYPYKINVAQYYP